MADSVWIPTGDELLPPRERGRTEIGDRAARRIAEHAACEVRGVRRTSIPMGDNAIVRAIPGISGNLPHADVTTSGQRTRVQIAISVEWPHPLGPAASSVRAIVNERMSSLTGLQVDAVDVRIVDVPHPVQPGRVVT